MKSVANRLHRGRNLCVTDKEGKLVILNLFLKGDDPLNPSQNRGIAIMPCLLKLFNSILNNRLQKYFDDNNVINETQIGFQPKARTSDHMFVLPTLTEKYQSLNCKLYACLLILKKHLTQLFTMFCFISFAVQIYLIYSTASLRVCIQTIIFI